MKQYVVNTMRYKHENRVYFVVDLSWITQNVTMRNDDTVMC